MAVHPTRVAQQMRDDADPGRFSAGHEHLCPADGTLFVVGDRLLGWRRPRLDGKPRKTLATEDRTRGSARRTPFSAIRRNVHELLVEKNAIEANLLPPPQP